MKIKLSRNAGSLTLAMVIVVATITIVCVGSYMIYKMQRHFEVLNQQRLQQMTNETDNVAAQLTADHPGSFAVTSFTIATQQVSVPILWVVETSTNLLDWETVLQTDDPAEADSAVSNEVTTGTEPVRFFRTLSRP